MAVYSIWESRFPAETAEEGIRVTKAIWGRHDLLRRLPVARADPGSRPAGPSLRRRPLGEPRSR